MQRPNLPEDDNVWQNAVVLIDKPQGHTSFDVCGRLRGTLSIKKAGPQLLVAKLYGSSICISVTIAEA